MLKVTLILLFLLNEANAATTVDLGTHPRGLTEKNITIDYTSCDMDFYDYEEYLDVNNDEGCHKIHMLNETIQEKYGKSVKSCCSFHGYLADGNCDGKDDKVKTHIHTYFSSVLHP